MKLKDWIIAICIFGLFSCANPTVYKNIDELQITLDALYPKKVELTGMKIEKQPTSSTCGITAVTVVSNYINKKNNTVNNLIEKYNVNTSKGSSTSDIKNWLSSENSDKAIKYKSNESNEIMISAIFDSLKNNIPVLAFLGSLNEYDIPNYDFHASVVYGIDITNQTIKIANSYGYSEETTLVDFINRMSFTEVDKYPSSQQFIIKMGMIDKNMYYLVN
jgi:hypothetical protein